MSFLKRLFGGSDPELTFTDRVWQTRVMKMIDRGKQTQACAEMGRYPLTVYHVAETEVVWMKLNDPATDST